MKICIKRRSNVFSILTTFWEKVKSRARERKKKEKERKKERKKERNEERYSNLISPPGQ